MSVVIVDYGSGNLRSAEKAFVRASREAGSSSAIVVSSDPHRVARADRVVLPGVGAFADCMAGLASTDGMVDALDHAVNTRAVPILGVCVGMQLFASRGLEHTVTQGFGWVPGDVRRLTPENGAIKVPHMGWNVLAGARAHPLLDGIPLGDEGWHAYFVHSYVIEPTAPGHLVASAEHGEAFAAIVGRDNVVGTQFHPEKSQRLGLSLIANFLSWSP